MTAERDEQLTAAQCPPTACPPDRPWARSRLTLCALLVVAASVTSAWWLGALAGLAVYATGTLVLVAALLGLARRSGRR